MHCCRCLKMYDFSFYITLSKNDLFHVHTTFTYMQNVYMTPNSTSVSTSYQQFSSSLFPDHLLKFGWMKCSLEFEAQSLVHKSPTSCDRLNHVICYLGLTSDGALLDREHCNSKTSRTFVCYQLLMLSAGYHINLSMTLQIWPACYSTLAMQWVILGTRHFCLKNWLL